jgi:excisionase family DNA binding protein
MNSEEEQLLTIKQAADYINISRWTIYKLIKDGTVKPIIGNGSVKFKGFRFKRADLTKINWERL